MVASINVKSQTSQRPRHVLKEGVTGFTGTLGKAFFSNWELGKAKKANWELGNGFFQ